jgi:hypothetical protein
VQKRALPGARRPDDPYHLATIDREINFIEGNNFLGAGAEVFAKSFGAQDHARAWSGIQIGVVYCYTRICLPLHRRYPYHTLDAEEQPLVCP